MVGKMNEAEKTGETIQWSPDGLPVVPENLIISYIEGDGT